MLEPEALIDAVATALADVSAGRVSMPPRIGAFTPDGLLGAMVAYVPSLDTLAAKLVSVFPRSAPSHHAVIAVFDPRTGAPVALMDGEAITAQRTAAASTLSVRLLARPDARVLAILGTGVQARAHAAYLRAGFAEVRVAGRNPQRAAELGGRVCATFEEAARGADVIVCATDAAEPFVKREWLRDGAHVVSVGFNRELEPAVFRDALVAVESRAAAFGPLPAGAKDLHAAGPLHDVVELGEKPSRGDAALTVYKSVGIAAEDAAAAAVVLRKIGTNIRISR